MTCNVKYSDINDIASNISASVPRANNSSREIKSITEQTEPNERTELRTSDSCSESKRGY